MYMYTYMCIYIYMYICIHIAHECTGELQDMNKVPVTALRAMCSTLGVCESVRHMYVAVRVAVRVTVRVAVHVA